MNKRGLIDFFRATCIGWGILNLFFLFIIILIMWIEGIKGYYFLIHIILLTFVYLLVMIKIIRDIKLEIKSIWKLITIGFLIFVSYQNYDFAQIVINNNGRYPCSLGASCP
ncbi:MAG: hypothetical protein ISP71_04440 [Flavobacteriales bacterium]|nr:hypothetical protein [Flavobacteriales bacterium]